MKFRFPIAFPSRAVTQATLEVALTAALPYLHQHQKRIAGGLGVVLAIMGATALGIAPQEAERTLSRTVLVTQTVQPTADLSAQLQSLADTSVTLYRTEVMRTNDTPSTLLRRLGVSHPQALDYFRTNATAGLLFTGYSRKLVQVKSDASG